MVVEEYFHFSSFFFFVPGGTQILSLVLKTSQACFFNAPIQLNLTINTPIPERPRPARFLFLAPIKKFLEIFPDPNWPGGIHLKPRYTGHWPDWCQDSFMFGFVVNLSDHFMYSLVYINVYHFTTIKILPPTITKIPALIQNYPVPNPPRFPDPGPDWTGPSPELSKIWLVTQFFWGGYMVRFGYPRWSWVPG